MSSETDDAATRVDWIAGDAFALPIPAHADVLRAGGPKALTTLFHATGALAADNAVVAITQADELNIGGAGAKPLPGVRYAHKQRGLSEMLS